MRKNYKELVHLRVMWEKRGQVTIFVILALVLVLIVLVIFLYPRLPFITETNFSPTAYLTSCLDKPAREQLAFLAKQGGYAHPEGVLQFQGNVIKYLCYTSENYKTCVIQQPMVKEHLEQELSKLLQTQAEQCAQQLKQEYERRGYSTSLGTAQTQSQLNPGKLNIIITAPLTVTKTSTQSFRSFSLEIQSEMYDLILTAQSILDYESTLGDSETTSYIRYYPDLTIEKIKLSEGSKVYTLKNVITQEQFKFATRSLSWPPGYGL